MNKAELVAAMADKAEISKKDAEAALPKNLPLREEIHLP